MDYEVQFKEYIDELFEYEITSFIDTLIKDGSITRDKIYYGYNDDIKPQHRDIKEWILINDFFDKDDLENDFIGYDISFLTFGDRIFVGLITETENLHKDQYWKKYFYDAIVAK